MYSFTPLTLFAWLHAQVRPRWGNKTCTIVSHEFSPFEPARTTVWLSEPSLLNKKRVEPEVKWHNLLLHTNYLYICRRVKASSLHLTTGTGNLQSCSPIIIPLLHYPLSGHKEESGNEASITLIYPSSHVCMGFMHLGLDGTLQKKRQWWLNSLLFSLLCCVTFRTVASLSSVVSAASLSLICY